jgi:hypothetical protein
MGYDEPKSSSRKYPQSVSQMLTGDISPKSEFFNSLSQNRTFASHHVFSQHWQQIFISPQKMLVIAAILNTVATRAMRTIGPIASPHLSGMLWSSVQWVSEFLMKRSL